MRVLVANRGEIARRLLRGLRSLGHETIAVYSEADASAPYLREADHTCLIGPPEPSASYLDPKRILDAGRRHGADAVHPGYGFLSENGEFAELVEAEGWTFIGPTPESIRSMGDKTAAGKLAIAAGVPTVPSQIPGADATPDSLLAQAKQLGFPLMLKAAAGGGGKGMRIAHDATEFIDLLQAAQREARAAFGDPRVFLERYVNPARHVEVQVVGDGAGGVLVLGERDCSIQRRHQKLIEEAPAPNLSPQLRERLHQSAAALVEHTRYRGAGTLEFIVNVDNDGNNTGSADEFFFLEMNTRLQVEHPVTEEVFGVDLLALQMQVAQGEPLDTTPRVPVGHAIEVRVYAESPANGFLPSIGHLHEVVWPHGPGIRVDSGFERGNEVSPHYDPMIAKIVAWGPDRTSAVERLRAALRETFIAGVQTTVPFCGDVIHHKAFRDAQLHTGFIPMHMDSWQDPVVEDDPWRRAAAALCWRLHETHVATASQGPTVFSTLGNWRLHPETP